ncbi:serine protease [Piscinibacter sp. HJYY11]|uniref:S1 family peptidase n=1 Tax=Piscinibacter sp. HJYY11 TaxID=2801333 RepID=UPI00191F02A4|nr:serine protease [Piscinibacter sp. HJYY11]MBL0730030.1 trypsin-like peptidase domain-containing protein [Piscinibacter sp. HJYY11]
MRNMQEATERICELKGNLVALEALVTAMMKVMPADAQEELKGVFEQHAEVARTVLLHVPISEHSISAFEADVGRTGRLIERAETAPAGGCDPVLLTVARVLTFNGTSALTAATGFFFETDERLYLVSSRHVFIDAPSGHHPDRIEIELHTDAGNLTQMQRLSIPLYRNGLATWRETHDSAGVVDVAVIEIDPRVIPPDCALQAWTPAHIEDKPSNVPVGSSLVVVGFPLGFHDTLHHLPVIRQGQVASSFGLRFQGQGYFLTDARTHRGTSGAPVLSHQHGGWKLLGIHAARLDMSARDQGEDESLGLNSAWYADVLARLTAH